ncbi:MAG TPA: NlpC/P60 family protein [Actinomycetota bacterium]|nr:NlpC/P60 family protein [Actinomycetota bacterium]
MQRSTTTTRSTLAVRLAIAALVVVSTSVLLSPPSSATPSREDVERAKAELDRLNQHVTLLVEQYNQAHLRLEAVQSRLDDAREAAQRAQAEADRAVQSLNRSASIAYQGVGSQFAALLEAESLADFSDRLEFIGSMAQSDSDLATEAAQAQQRARWSAEELRAALEEQRALVEKLKAKASEIRKAAAEARAYYEELSRKYQDYLDRLEAARTGPSSPPPAPSGGVQAVLNAAYSVIGTPYQWGGSSPETGFDCSGFTMWAWAHGGVSLPHSSAAQYSSLPHVDRADLQPGDLLFFYSPISHVAIYVGGNSMIHSPHTGSVVSVVSVYWDSFVGAARPG